MYQQLRAGQDGEPEHRDCASSKVEKAAGRSVMRRGSGAKNGGRLVPDL
jgi:hypothetical protein